MNAKTTIRPQLTADAIRRAAIERLGVSDAMVTRYRSRQTFVIVPEFGELADCVGGEWHALAVQRRHGERFEIVARRRTCGELLAFVESYRVSSGVANRVAVSA